jgi:hypothetical protein
MLANQTITALAKFDFEALPSIPESAFSVQFPVHPNSVSSILRLSFQFQIKSTLRYLPFQSNESLIFLDRLTFFQHCDSYHQASSQMEVDNTNAIVEQQDQEMEEQARPNQSIYINNLNERIKKEGTTLQAFLFLSRKIIRGSSFTRERESHCTLSEETHSS